MAPIGTLICIHKPRMQMQAILRKHGTGLMTLVVYALLVVFAVCCSLGLI